MNSDNKKGVLVITHLQAEGACRFGETLHARGLRMRTVNAARTDLSEIDPLRPDLLMVMGGPIGVYQADHYPFLYDEIDILKKRLAADLPTIGICLGSQLMAAALGANVYKSDSGKEVGWHGLDIAPDAPPEIHHLAGDKTSMFHWHGDTFDLPDGAKLLASSANYKNQIFSHGENALGIQCHPEVTRFQLPEWFVMFVGQICGPNAIVPVEKLRADTEKHIDTLEKQAALFFNEWLDNRGF